MRGWAVGCSKHRRPVLGRDVFCFPLGPLSMLILPSLTLWLWSGGASGETPGGQGKREKKLSEFIPLAP